MIIALLRHALMDRISGSPVLIVIGKGHPNLTSLGISLSEAVAAAEAKADEPNALKVAADATKALGKRRVTGVGY